jgi:hypothetical protein
MRLMIALFLLVFLIILDQTWFGGHYLNMAARGTPFALVQMGL